MSNHKYVQGTHEITKDEISALRAGNRFYARVNTDGQCTLEGIETFTRHGKEVEIHTDVECGWSLTDYEKESPSNPIDTKVAEYRYTCFVSVWHATLATIVQHVLKPGDILSIHWIRCNYSQAAEERGVTMDEMELHILRGDPAKGQRKKLTFMLAREMHFLAHGEIGRMIRRKVYARDYSLTV